MLGKQKPTFVFLNGDGADFTTSWKKVTNELEGLGTCLLFNRDGIGENSKPTVKQTAEVVIQTIIGLLDNLQIEPPFVLVGHSSGGLFANLFARLYPDKVCGVVFVDSAHPDQFEELKDDFTLVLKLLLWAMARLNSRSEIAHIKETAKRVNSAGPFPTIPVAVLTGEKTEAPRWLEKPSLMKKKLQLHERLAALSTNSRHIKTKNSGHFISIDEPELVVGAIKWVRSELG